MNDQIFGGRMAVSMGPIRERSEKMEGFIGFVKELDMVAINPAKVDMPSRPARFLLSTRPAGRVPWTNLLFTSFFMHCHP